MKTKQTKISKNKTKSKFRKPNFKVVNFEDKNQKKTYKNKGIEERNETFETKSFISCVESFTGGGFAAKIVSKPGASRFFAGGLVTYQNEIKAKLGIDISNGVINRETALAMAKAGNEFFNSKYCFSFTGNAGPKVLDEKPVGEVYIALNKKVWKLNFGGSRTNIIKKAIEFAYKQLQLIQKKEKQNTSFYTLKTSKNNKKPL